MYLSTLSDWLNHISKIHPQEIELGLDRVRLVASNLGVMKPRVPTIVVGGTNGKGSTVATLEAIYRAAEYRVGCFTSPYLFRFNEEVRINGVDATDEEFCEAFTAIDKARGDITLTPFEFHTLAALLIMKSHKLDVMILEVGLGGRLDAVNIIDADVSIVTTIDIDHVEWLGDTREAIAIEKAGIFRKNKPAISGDFNPPLSLLETARDMGAFFYSQGHDFGFIEHSDHWSFMAEDSFEITDLPLSSFATQNMASALMAICQLQESLPVTNDDIVKGIKNIELRARIEVVPGAITKIYDVAHNPHACQRLADYLQKTKGAGNTYAVFSMLKEKDIAACIQILKPEIDKWFVAPLSVPRGASMALLQERFADENIEIETAANVKEAYDQATHQAARFDRIVCFGSFGVIAEVL